MCLNFFVKPLRLLFLILILQSHINGGFAQSGYWQQHVKYEMDIDMNVVTNRFFVRMLSQICTAHSLNLPQSLIEKLNEKPRGQVTSKRPSYISFFIDSANSAGRLLPVTKALRDGRKR